MKRCHLILALMISASLPSLPLWAQSENKTTESKPTPDVVHIEAIAVTTVADDIDGGTGGLSMGRDGNLYSGDFGWNLGGPGKGGDQVFQVTPNGEVKLFCRQMKGASGNAIDSQGNLYQSSIRGNFVSKVTPDGTVSVVTRKGLRSPVGIAVGDANELYVCNCGSNSIQKVLLDGTSTLFCRSPLLNCPNGIARGNDGKLYVCNFGNGDVIEISKDGKQASRLATLPGNNNGHLTFFENHLYVIARSDHRVYKVALDGTTTFFVGNGQRGKTDGTADACSLSLPNSITVSADGKFMYINETSPITGNPRILGPTRIRKIELRRTVGGPAPAAKVLQQPTPGLATAIGKAQNLLGQQDFAGAEKILRPLAEKNPKLPGPTYLLGYALHGMKKYDEARSMYEKVTTFPQVKANCHYNIACTYALQGKSDAAIQSLKDAIGAGFNDFAQMKRDTDFDSLRDDPRFQALLPK